MKMYKFKKIIKKDLKFGSPKQGSQELEENNFLCDKSLLKLE